MARGPGYAARMVGKPNPAQRARTRAAIERSALDLFSAHGFDAVTIEQIAQHAGVSARTVYRHYPVKELLVLEDVPGNLDFAESAINTARDGSPTTIFAEIAARVAPAPDQIQDSLLRMRLIHESPSLRAAALETAARFETTLAQLLARTSGRAVDDPLVRAATAIILAVHRVNNEIWYEAGGQLPWREISDSTSAVVEAALGRL